MHSILTIQTPVGRALFSSASPGLSLQADVSDLAGFRLDSAAGLIVWTERLKNSCIIVHGRCSARSELVQGELRLVVQVDDGDGSLVERYSIPAVDVMAVTPFDDAAAHCRELLARQCAARQLH